MTTETQPLAPRTLPPWALHLGVVLFAVAWWLIYRELWLKMGDRA